MLKVLKLNNLKLSNLRLNTKLMASFILVALITLVVGIVGWNGISQLSGFIEAISSNQMPRVQALLTINEAKTAIDGCEKALLNASLTSSQREIFYSRIQDRLNQIDINRKIFEAKAQTKEEVEIWPRLVSALQRCQKNDVEFLRLSRQYDTDKSKDTFKQMLYQGLEIDDIAFARAENLLNQLVPINFNIVAEVSKQAKTTVNWVTITALIGMIIGALLALTLGIILSFSIAHPMNSAVARLGEGAQQIAAASSQLAASAQQLSQGSAEQASAIEETSSTLQETGSMLQQNTANTIQAAQLSQQAKESAGKGNSEMQEMMSSIQEIKKSSDKISKIIKVIDDIAFQTNILALNAAIEAARAGEAGMGFAVVAEEVRNLAQRSSQAAKDTTAIIETNIELSGKGVVVAERVREALIEITDQTKKVNELMGEIAAATQEQAQGVDQVNMGMSQIETVTQQNASNAEESASAAEELSAQADNMRKIVNELSQLVHGKVADLKVAMLDMNHQIHQSQQVEQAVKTIGAIASDSMNYDTALPDKTGRKTKITSPEDVISLEKDPHHF
jgi:methyl-accepting chemotaxis protein